MSTDPRHLRAYDASALPALKADPPKVALDDFRLVLYSRVCESWRALIDVRFKLLALVPIVSGFGVGKVLETTSGMSPVARTGLAVVGLLATLGLLIYDLRNSELHDELISRGRRIEEELGVDTGQFRGRPKPTRWLIQHDYATALIYGVSLLGWAFALFMVWAGV